MDQADLKDWAIVNDIHPSVFQFLAAYGSMSQHGVIYAPLVTWKQVSDIVNQNLEKDQEKEAVTQKIGIVGATHFAQYLMVCRLIDHVEPVLSGKMTQFDTPADMSEEYFWINQIGRELAQRAKYVKASWGENFRSTPAYDDWLQQANNALTFVMKNCSAEMVVLFVKNMLGAYQLPVDVDCMPLLLDFGKSFRHLILEDKFD